MHSRQRTYHKASRRATVAATLLAVAAGPAVSGGDPPVTLAALWALALAGNPELAAARQAAARRAAALGQARAERGALLALDARAGTISERQEVEIPAGVIDADPRSFAVGRREQLDTGVTLRQALYSGGAIAGQIRLAALASDMAQQRSRLQCEDVCLGLVRTAVALTKARGERAVLEDAAQQAQACLHQAEAFEAQGLAARMDVLEAQIRAGDVARARAAAAQAAESAQALLNRLLGRALDTPVPAVDWGPNPAAVAPLDDCRRTALEQRPERRVAQALVAQARAGVGLARSAYQPKLGVALGYHYGNPHSLTGDLEPYWDANVAATWTLWDTGRTRQSVRQAARAVDETEALLRGQEQQIALEVYAAYRQWEERQDSLTSLAASRAKAREVLRLAQERFAAGDGRIAAVLEAQWLRASTENACENARMDVTLARLELLHAMGVLSAALP